MKSKQNIPDDTIIEARWYIDSDDGYEYLINLMTFERIAKRDRSGKLLPL